MLVSAADKLHNARAILSDYRQIGDKLWSRFNASQADTLWYYGELSKAITAKLTKAPQLANELRITVAALPASVAR